MNGHFYTWKSSFSGTIVIGSNSAMRWVVFSVQIVVLSAANEDVLGSDGFDEQVFLWPASVRPV